MSNGRISKLTNEEVLQRIADAGIKVGDRLKSISELFSLLNLDYGTGEGHKRQITILKCFMDWEPAGERTHAIIITHVYNKPMKRPKIGRPLDSKNKEKKTKIKKNCGSKKRVNYQDSVCKMFGLLLAKDTVSLGDENLIYVFFKTSFGIRMGLLPEDKILFEKSFGVNNKTIYPTFQDSFILKNSMDMSSIQYLESALKKLSRIIEGFSWKKTYIQSIKNDGTKESILVPLAKEDVEAYKNKVAEEYLRNIRINSHYNQRIPLSINQQSSFNYLRGCLGKMAGGSIYSGYIVKFNRNHLLNYINNIFEINDISAIDSDATVLQCYNEVSSLYCQSVVNRVDYYSKYYQTKGWNKVSFWSKSSGEIQKKMSVDIKDYAIALLDYMRKEYADMEGWKNSVFQRVF